MTAVTINGNELNVEVLGPPVVVFDARGCGQSEGRPPFSHAQWAADIDGLRQWLGADQVVVAGGSYGGFVAMEYAIAYPERTRALEGSRTAQCYCRCQ